MQCWKSLTEITEIKSEQKSWELTVWQWDSTLLHSYVCLYLPQTVPATIEASAESEPDVEAKTLPQRRPPLVWSGTEMAAMAAVSAPGI